MLDVEDVNLLWKAGLFEHDRGLVTVRRLVRIQANWRHVLSPVGMDTSVCCTEDKACFDAAKSVISPTQTEQMHKRSDAGDGRSLWEVQPSASQTAQTSVDWLASFRRACRRPAGRLERTQQKRRLVYSTVRRSGNGAARRSAICTTALARRQRDISRRAERPSESPRLESRGRCRAGSLRPSLRRGSA